MECQNCELRQRQFCCENCLKQQLQAFRHQISPIVADRDAHIASAQRSLITVVNPQRTRRADVKGGEERVREIWDGLAALRKANEKNRERIRSLREELSTRRRTLAAANTLLTQEASSVSPPTQTLPGSFPGGPFSTPPQNARPVVGHRKHSSTPSSHTPSPSRPPSSIARNAQAFPQQSSRAPALHGRTPSTPSSHSPTPFQKHSPAQPYATSTVGDRELVRQIEDAAYQLNALSDTIARARSGLVQELVEVFSVVEVGGRPPIGVKAGTKGEWTIGGLVLPVPGDMRRYPPDHINAVLTHTLHFLTLLAFYLGIKLPFEVVWSRSSTPPTGSQAAAPPNLRGNGLLGVGTPWIGAIKGSEHGGWAKWSTKHPLHVSMSSSTSGSTSPATSSPPQTLRTLGPSRTASAPPPPSLEDSQLEDGASTRAQGSSFTTALAMLLYDVCFLAHTQGVAVPLAGAGDVLGNLWAVCGARELGRASHAAHAASARLSPPTPPGFQLEFAQLLQATAANPSRARARVVGGGARRAVREEDAIVEEEDWDIVDDVSG
ncbi:hypothetical protein PsYK624_145830 [Phanerochaete sordida]|uniref:Autophagy-related protein 14 n=1 Tax=Phanerochaete sordida TaxID=48140 RepID=A0A9P3GQ81_9APHY|nr:hypothetical protein PsYK624_145830 [Phanerochaete sordida]